MSTDNPNIKNALQLCDKQGIEISFEPCDLGEVHPNTVLVQVVDKKGDTQSLMGCSIGGGEIEIRQINGFDTNISGNYPAIITKHHDKVGVIKSVVSLISDCRVNIVTINLSRAQKGKMATAIIETDEMIESQMVQEMKSLDGIVDVLTMRPF